MDLVIVCADLRSVTVFLSLRSSNLDYSGVSPSQPARYAWFNIMVSSAVLWNVDWGSSRSTFHNIYYSAGGARRRRLRADESASRGSRPAPSPASADQVRAHKIHPQHLPDSALVSSYCARVSDFVTSRLPGGAASCCCAAATGVESACRKPRGRRRRGRRGLHTAGLKRRLRAATDPLHSAFSPGAWMRPPLPPLPPPPPPEHGEPSGPPEGGWNDGAGGATHCPLQG
jgi:hypothetical protein